MTETKDRKTERRKKRAPRKATSKYLDNAALYYLQRFATSAENLRRVLTRKVDLSARFHGTDPDEGRAQVDDIIRRFLRSGLLDDDAYARARVQSLHRRGNSARLIRGKLKQKGVDDDIIAAALDARGEDTEDGEDPELTAAVTLAKRRRLGPFSQEARRAESPTGTKKEMSDETREKHLAALARAGFSYAVARRVIDGKDIDGI